MIDWDAVGAIGEIVGAVAVVATLGYLALQIKQSTKVARSATRQSIAEMSVASASDITDDPSLAEAMIKDLRNETLAPVERIRMLARCYKAMRHWENIHYQYLAGMLSEDEWRGFRLNLKGLAKWPSMKEYWQNERQFFSAAFQSEVSAIQRELADESSDPFHGYAVRDPTER